MPITEKRLTQFAPSVSEMTYYTTPVNTATILANILIANTSAVPIALFLSVVTAGGVPGPANRIVPGTTIGANQLVPIDLATVMAAGDFISAYASAIGLSIYVSGTERAATSAVSTGSVVRGTRRYRTTLYARSNFR
jgi:hypothetical protein